MKRGTKLLFSAAVFFGAQVVINRWIFKEANRRVKWTDNEYEWKYGRVRYVTAGEGEPLLLIHNAGIGAGLHEWERCIGALAKRYKVYALDLTGFGCSGKPALTYSAYLYSQLIGVFVRDIIKKPAYVASSNFSCTFALSSAIFYPELFKKILLVSPSGVAIPDAHNGIIRSFLLRAFELPVLGTSIFNIIASRRFTRSYLEKYAYSNRAFVTPELVDKYYFSAHAGGANNRYAAAAMLSGNLDCNIERLIDKASAPVHIVWGTDNILNPISNLDTLKARNKGISFTEIEGAMLLPHSEAPKEFYKACCRFFG